ncbi:MAG: response regulator [Gammaproteobacteria bacterium]
MSTNKTILIIDDEPFNIDILKVHLTDEGYTILTAENGQLGLNILNNNKKTIDVILLDRKMPIMNGMEFLEIIKKDSSINNIPIIMQTAATSDSEVIEGINAGAYYYLTKPFQAEIMLSIVKAAISDYSRHKEISSSSLAYDLICDMVNEIECHFKTLQEADILSRMIANLYPTPVKVIMGITELLINSVEHGNLGISYAEKTKLVTEGSWNDEVNNRLLQKQYQKKYTSVKFLHCGSGIKLIIKDQGDGFDFKKYLKVDPSRAFDPHGRGIAISAMISFDEIKFIGSGNEVHCFSNFKK